MSFIKVKSIYKKYGDLAALRDVTFFIEAKEWIAIMGPSGSGKTTLINILGTLDHATSGEVIIGGINICNLSENARCAFRREKIGFIFQQYHLIPYLTAVQNIMLAQHFHSMADSKEAHEALKRLGLDHRAHHLPSQLSGGEQQRLCIARALINNPILILADEPTGNLDEKNERIVMDIFHELHNEGRTIIMVTHDMNLGRLATRRLELQHGVLTSVVKEQHDTEELYDEVLQQLWEKRETQGTDCSDNPPLLKNKDILQAMLERGLVCKQADGFVLTDQGNARARDIIRRHRLAERLFQDTLKMSGELIEPNACAFEHVISAEVERGICCFLSHPKTCPHGRLIPAGKCCTEK